MSSDDGPYGPLRTDHLSDVQRQAGACGRAQIAVFTAIARVSAKYDRPKQEGFHPGRSRAPAGESLWIAV